MCVIINIVKIFNCIGGIEIEKGGGGKGVENVLVGGCYQKRTTPRHMRVTILSPHIQRIMKWFIGHTSIVGIGIGTVGLADCHGVENENGVHGVLARYVIEKGRF